MAASHTNAFRQFKSLPQDQYDEIVGMFERGVPATRVAQIIHEKWDVLHSMNRASLIRTLQRFNDIVVKGELVRRVVAHALPLHQKELAHRVEVIDELEELARIQKGRLHKMLAREAQAPMLIKQVSDEARILADLLSKIGQLHLDTGVLRRAPKHILGTVTDDAGKVTEFSVHEEVAELMKVIDDVEYKVVDQGRRRTAD